MTAVRKPYYLHPAALPAAPLPAVVQPAPVFGLQGIAAVLRTEPGKVKRMIYPDKRRGREGDADPIPVWREPGVGLVSDRQVLLAWWNRRLQRAAAGPRFDTPHQSA